MPSPTDIYCTFEYTVTTANSLNRFDLYIDEETKPIATSNAPINPVFRIPLSIGKHRYEIKCANRQLVNGQVQVFTSKAAAGSFEVDFNNRNFIVGTSDNEILDELTQALLDFANWADGIATYSIDLTTLGATWVCRQYANKGAAKTSANYNAITNGYNQFSGTGGSFSDDYPLGAQVHVEVRDESNGLNVIDFVAGAPDSPKPASVDVDKDHSIGSIQALAANQEGEGEPPVDQVIIFLQGDVPEEPVTFTLQEGFLTFQAQLSDFEAGELVLTSGDVFDYLYALTDATVTYMIVDENGIILSVNTVNFGPHQ